MSSIYDWSLAAADNANADDSINWAEGQPPSTVNNSARAMMARLAELLADLGGTAAAGGLPNVLTLKSKAPIHAYEDGLIIRFRASGLNGAKTTLNLNNLGARQIMKAGAARPAELEGGELQAGSLYECVYSTALGSGGAWFLLSPAYSPPHKAPVPAGFIAAYAYTEAPAGWLKCNGAWYNNEDYPALYAAIGGRWGGDGSRFAVPDLRGEFIRGWDDGRNRGTQKGRGFGTWEDDRLKYHRHRGATEGGGGHSHQYALWSLGSADGGGKNRGTGGGMYDRQTGWAGDHSHGFTTDWGVDEDARMADETRPMNMALLYCIKI